MNQNIYKTKFKKIKGHDYRTVYNQAFSLYKAISSKTKRRPYIKSKYFGKEKVFLDYFWQHLHEKTANDRVRRLKYYYCGIDLIKNSRLAPEINKNPNKISENLFRFKGITLSNDIFYVQIKETKRGDKCLMSVFPEE